MTQGDRFVATGYAEAAEASAFLAWLADNHFTFLGYREYRLDRGASVDRLVPVPRSGRLTGTHTPTSAAPVCWRSTAWVRMRPR